MVIFWRGLGISVVIILFLVGFITAFFFDGMETKVFGNTLYLSWVLLVSGILLTLIGLGTWKGEIVQDVGVPPYRKKHDLFWIPIIFWGAFFLIMGIYLMFFVEHDKKENLSSTGEDGEIEYYEPTTRKVNFYNASTSDTVRAIVADDVITKGLVFNRLINPNSIYTETLNEGTYMFMSSSNGQTLLKFPPDNPDTSKFTLHTDEQGSFYQRNLTHATASDKDYDEAWLMIDGKTGLALVAIDKLVDGEINSEKLELLTDSDIKEVYPPNDLIEPNPSFNKENGQVVVVSPAEKLKKKTTEDEKHYALVPFSGDEISIDDVKKYLLETKF